MVPCHVALFRVFLTMNLYLHTQGFSDTVNAREQCQKWTFQLLLGHRGCIFMLGLVVFYPNKLVVKYDCIID